MTPTFVKMSSVLFETEQYASRATVSFQHLIGYIEQIARFIISSVLHGSQDVLEINGGLWNLDSLKKTPTGIDNPDSFPPLRNLSEVEIGGCHHFTSQMPDQAPLRMGQPRQPGPVSSTMEQYLQRECERFEEFAREDRDGERRGTFGRR
jgi:hypothetical protein